MNQGEILDILNEQLDYLEDHSFKSYDLCDITSQKYFLWVNKKFHGKSWGKYIIFPHNLVIKYFTPLLRKLYGIKRREFAQANAFIVRGLLNIYQITKEEKYLKIAESLIERILVAKSDGFRHACWGQPYDWFSGKVIPAYTPRTTVSSQIGKMFLDAYSATGETKYLEEAKEIGDFFIEEMPLSFNEEGKTCFSYTTIDSHKVHNPNMMASGFLISLWKETNNKAYYERAISAAGFTYSHINKDGSWYYAWLPGGKASKIDNYHTGYNLEGSLALEKHLDKPFVHQSEFENAIAYYESNLFDENGVPFLTNKKKYPTDIQCCAQSIITFSLLSDSRKKYHRKAIQLYKWTTENMYKDGSFYYRILKNGSIDKTDYIRWGDAWMFFAGSLLLLDSQ